MEGGEERQRSPICSLERTGPRTAGLRCVSASMGESKSSTRTQGGAEMRDLDGTEVGRAEQIISTCNWRGEVSNGYTVDHGQVHNGKMEWDC